MNDCVNIVKPTAMLCLITGSSLGGTGRVDRPTVDIYSVIEGVCVYRVSDASLPLVDKKEDSTTV